MRLALLLLVLPVALAYPLGAYTDGKDVYVRPGEEVKLVLPFPEGEECLPVTVIKVSGGEDYPEVNVNGWVVEGNGVHRVVLNRADTVTVTIRSSGPAMLSSDSLFYCTRDPFVFVKYVPPSPIRAGTYNFLSVVLINYGFSEGNVKLLLDLHTNLAPFSKTMDYVKIPPRSRASYNIFLVSAPFKTVPSAHPRVCISYRDSVMQVLDCDGPVPTNTVTTPRVTCIGGRCYNTSNLEIELNGERIGPGHLLPDGVPLENFEGSLDIAVINPTSEFGGFGADLDLTPWLLISIGALFAVVLSVAFK